MDGDRLWGAARRDKAVGGISWAGQPRWYAPPVTRSDPDAGYDFGYSWAWQHGHAILAVVFAVITLACARLGTPDWIWIITAGLAGWAAVGYLLVMLVFRQHRVMPMPDAAFLTDGEGTVVDLGCGSGRTSIMLGLARPRVHIIGLDDFSATYIRDHGEARLLRNLEIAGVADRFELQRGDMLDLPFDDGSLDGAISSYALDHLKDRIPTALSEVHRVLRPGGQMLLMVILPDPAMLWAYAGLVALAFPTRARWRAMFADAGLQVMDEARACGGGWFLLSR